MAIDTYEVVNGEVDILDNENLKIRVLMYDSADRVNTQEYRMVCVKNWNGKANAQIETAITNSVKNVRNKSDLESRMGHLRSLVGIQKPIP